MGRKLGAGGDDANSPTMVTIPIFGEDGYSRRMAVLNFLRGNPFSPASWGVGVRPAPAGASSTEGTKSTAYLPPQQTFRGVVKTVVDPTLKTITNVSSFPSANVQVNPVLIAMSNAQQRQGM